MNRRAAAKGLVLAFAFAAGAGTLSCAKTPRTVDAYFPLAVGNEWIYSLEAFGNRRGLVFEVRDRTPAPDGVRFLLDESGTHYYVRTADGVSVSMTPGIWTVLLEGPITLGRRFDGGRTTGIDLRMEGEPVPANTPFAASALQPIVSSGYKVITGLDRTVEVAAGTFENCIEVTHVAGPILGVKYFAPGVGLVFGESWTIRDGVRSRTTRQELLWYRVGARTSGTRPEYIGPAVPGGPGGAEEGKNTP